MGRELASDKVELHETENDDFSDLELIYHVRDALISVQLGNRDNYDELVGHLHPKQRPTADQVALLVTTLKALSGAVSYIDIVHHEALIFAVSRLSMWNYGTDVMDALLELIISLVCLPTVVEEFLRQAKAAHLFTTSESFVFNDVLESDLSRAFGGMDRLDMFFPFDPCLLKKSDGYIHKYFIYWSMVRTTYESDDISDEGSGSESEDDDDAMMMGSYAEKGLDIESVLSRMSITPKNPLKYERMPSRIRPSTSPESL